ncbi:MAG: HPr family phosphocarrier protein [Candidatus Paraimprobicoccus trichonymphae]|uniref:HPr family phosphocarrier protein n=1 Tax=Candidatus Paraimprobicoccus trichonymphae TaxID=3033793 RepID=A0AA48HWS3_9FIRM|nr:MAG: HPr family phosphocarrier protein [Candidatus Paraimprobicoccus trichonymphae]
MYAKKIVIKNDICLNFEEVVFLVKKSNEFESRIWFEVEEKKINAKSLLGTLILKFPNKSELTVLSNGKDEKTATNTLVKYIKFIIKYSMFR